ncbi:hypothetical protein QQF64_013845 [Cirrhinus molitorella]|uniref:Uncharacterized protein n=1 Tax=Cirrhinus molitorella TaxID=172907 RepID=A0ABR3LSB9_9TELE
MKGNVDQCTLHRWDSGVKLLLSFTVTGDLISSDPQGGTKAHVPNLSDCREPREQGRQTKLFQGGISLQPLLHIPVWFCSDHILA